MITILIIDNDVEIRNGLVEFFKSDPINEYNLLESDFTDFDSKIAEADLVITDYNHDNVDSSAGLKIFQRIQKSKFAPVLIYSGFIPSIDSTIRDNEGPFLKIIEKGANSADNLKIEVNILVNSKEFKVKKAVEDNLAEAVNRNFREYYWNYIQLFWNDFKDLDADILKRILTRKVIKDIHPSLSEGEKIHPIEFYEHPVLDGMRIETGSILKKDESYFICINNDCDIEVRADGTCKAKKIYLLKVNEIELSWYSSSSNINKKNEADSKLLNNNSEKRDSKFILPKTFFFNGGYVDFGDIISVGFEIENRKIKLDEIGKIIAKIHSPFIHRLISNFASYYSRFGTPDIDITSCISEQQNNIGE